MSFAAENLPQCAAQQSSTGGKLIYDPYTGEYASDKGKGFSTEGVTASQEELLVWEMSSADRAESDWKEERRRFMEQTAAEEKRIEKLVADYIILKKSAAAVERARENKQRNGDDVLVRRGMQTMDDYLILGVGPKQSLYREEVRSNSNL